MTGLIDTHCHIQSVEAESGERTTLELWAKAGGLSAATVLANAIEAGVEKMVCVGCDLEDSKLAVDFVQGRKNCYASIGIHPHEAQHYAGKQDLLEEFAQLAASQKVVAVGECGFDFYYNHSPKEAQTEVLKFQLELAQEHNLPLIFHVREAFDDFWQVYDNFPGLRGVLHSFTDSKQNLDKAIERGLYVGVNGIATFAKNPEQSEVYRSIPLSNLLLETDAPFLTPTPYRGSINEPKNVRVIAEFVANLRGASLENIAAATTHNAHTLFGLS
jgi:TatD DNase family protein